MAKEYRLKGHESFVPREGWITKGIHAVKENPDVFSAANFYGADALGVGANMAKSIRYWLTAMSLAEVKKEAHLTDFGEIIYEKDPFLEDNFTLWLLHDHLVTNRKEASVWYVFFQCGVDVGMTREEWQRAVDRHFRQEFGQPEVNEKSLSDDVNALLMMYTKKRGTSSWKKSEPVDPEEKSVCPFSELGLVMERDKRYSKSEPNLYEFPDDILLYRICKLLGESSSEVKTLSLERLYAEKEGVKNIYHLSAVAMNDILDRLMTKGLIRIDRTAGLDVLYLTEKLDETSVIKNHYTAVRI